MKLLQQPLDIFLSHDWPRGIEQYGDVSALLRKKSFLREEIATNTFGNPATTDLVTLLKPKYWFAAHMHVKFPALVKHEHAQCQTQFLSLDKCLPRREFLQIIDVDTEVMDPSDYRFEYDPEWLAVVRACDPFMSLEYEGRTMSGDVQRYQTVVTTASSLDDGSSVKESLAWIQSHVQDFSIPLNFTPTSPVQLASDERWSQDLVRQCMQGFRNPQTVAFCQMLQIRNFAMEVGGELPMAPRSMSIRASSEMYGNGLFPPPSFAGVMPSGTAPSHPFSIVDPNEIVMDHRVATGFHMGTGIVSNPDEIVIEDDSEVVVANPDEIAIKDDGEVMFANPDEIVIDDDSEVEIPPVSLVANPDEIVIDDDSDKESVP